jgi:hypothetical protein
MRTHRAILAAAAIAAVQLANELQLPIKTFSNLTILTSINPLKLNSKKQQTLALGHLNPHPHDIPLILSALHISGSLPPLHCLEHLKLPNLQLKNPKID